MEEDTVILFTRNGLGDAPAELLFYGEGVKLACTGSPVIHTLQTLLERGTGLILCRTCLDYFGLMSQIEAGEIKGMPDILAAMRSAGKVISV